MKPRLSNYILADVQVHGLHLYIYSIDTMIRWKRGEREEQSFCLFPSYGHYLPLPVTSITVSMNNLLVKCKAGTLNKFLKLHRHGNGWPDNLPRPFRLLEEFFWHNHSTAVEEPLNVMQKSYWCTSSIFTGRVGHSAFPLFNWLLTFLRLSCFWLNMHTG